MEEVTEHLCRELATAAESGAISSVLDVPIGIRVTLPQLPQRYICTPGWLFIAAGVFETDYCS